jgi:phosphatidylglycerophosphate synthase
MSKSVLTSAGLVCIAITGTAAFITQLLDLSPLFPAKVMAIFGLAAAVLAVLAGKHLASTSFGPANNVTLVRSAITSALFALIGENAGASVAWFAVFAAAMALALDGVDGWLARRRGISSDFGARFDMETDALLIFGMSILAWQHGKAGSWILVAGLMRYIFIVSSYLLPWLDRKLPGSNRRRVIFVVQAVTLIICLAPALQPPLSDAMAFAGLTLLSASFAIDAAWLARARS